MIRAPFLRDSDRLSPLALHWYNINVPIASPTTEELIDQDLDLDLDRPWNVILYNDDWHPFDQVVLQVQKATGYCLEKAEHITYEAHTTGRAVAYTGARPECQRVATVLREIRLQVEIDEA